IDGIRINQIDLSGAKSGRVVYVVSIPQSLDAPHMASDKRYYKRFNFESVPMEDYEVRDVARRSAAPNLWLFFSIVGQPIVNSNSTSGRLRVGVGNKSPVPAGDAHFLVYLDQRIQLDNQTFKTFVEEKNLSFAEVEFGGQTVPMHALSENWPPGLRPK